MLKEQHFYRLLESAVESAGDGIVITADRNEEFRINYANDAFLRICGLDRDEAMGADFRTLLAGQDEQIGARILREALARNEGVRIELTMKRKDRSDCWVDVFARPIENACGNAGHYVGIIKDISERKQGENTLRLAARVFESFDDAVVIVDRNSRIVNANASFISSTGFLLKDVVNRPPEMIGKLRSKKSAGKIWQQLETDMNWRGESLVHCKDGSTFPVWMTVSVDRNADGNISNYILGLTDISDFKESQLRLQFLSNYDSLTGLLNRNLFTVRLTQSLAEARKKRRRMAVLFIDLDQFKIVNDSLGHAAGDTLLVSTAERLRHAVREGDWICRLGADEFMVAVGDLQAHEQAIQAAARIQESLSAPFDLGGRTIVSTAGIGISLYPEDGEDAETLIRKADTAMFKAKEGGRGMFEFFTEDMNEEVHERLTLEQGLRVALRKSELFLHFQPQVALTDMRISGLEALLRWQHPELGLVSPARFIPIAETSGLILPIGEWVIAETARKLNGWNGSIPGGLKVSFNLSPVQFRQGNIDDIISGILEESRVSPEIVEVEITESAIMDNRESTRDMMRKLKNIGLSIAIDDFGIGYSSLSYLKRFPVDRLKIDRSFVSGVSDNRQDAAIVAAIISVAHSLDIDVVAEGVETEQQLDFLCAHGCEHAQGFLFSRPVVPEEVSGLLHGPQLRRGCGPAAQMPYKKNPARGGVVSDSKRRI